MRIVDIKARATVGADAEYQVGFLQSCLGNGATAYRDERFRYYIPGDGKFNTELLSITRLLTDSGLTDSWAGQESYVKTQGNRGHVIEAAIYKALQNGNPKRLDIPKSWIEDLTAVPDGKKCSWVRGYWNWFDEHSPVYSSHQKYVCDPDARIAGEYDLCIEGDGPPAVLHLNPKFAKGFIFREYPDAVEKWSRLREARLASLEAYKAVLA